MASSAPPAKRREEAPRSSADDNPTAASAGVEKPRVAGHAAVDDDDDPGSASSLLATPEKRLAVAVELDRADALRALASRFHHPQRKLLHSPSEQPRGEAEEKVVYLCGNSLGLQPTHTKELVSRELDRWADLGVEGQFRGPQPWVDIEDTVVKSLARVVGAREREVVAMNSVTVNLHLMLASFYRPTATRNVILMERKAFPSDEHAIRSHVALRGQQSAGSGVVVYINGDKHNADSTRASAVRGDDDEGASPNTEDVLQAISRYRDSVALVILGAVNYYTGELFDLRRITAEAHRVGALAGFDLAHAAGNVDLALHDWECDFAVWCNYKYLNAGPGAIGGAFVHEKHFSATPGLTGWWGTRRSDRFEMSPVFTPEHGAARWQLSNPPVLQMAALRASLDVFDEVPSLQIMHEKRRALSLLMERCLRAALREGEEYALLTPHGTEAARNARGCQMSIVFKTCDLIEVHRELEARGFVCDVRKPNVLRVAAVPLYNSFQDVARFVNALAAIVHRT